MEIVQPQPIYSYIPEEEFMPTVDCFDQIGDGPDVTKAAKCRDDKLVFNNINLEETFNSNRHKFKLKHPEFKDIGIYKLLENDYVYHGGWKDQEYHGRGVLHFKTGIYEGTFNAGVMQGEGVFIFFVKGSDDKFDIYKGEVQDGLPHGKGTYLWHNDNKYEGNFYKGAIQGQGNLIWNDESTYRGQWKDNKCNGQGKFVDEEMPEYDFEGEYQNHNFIDKDNKKK